MHELLAEVVTVIVDHKFVYPCADVSHNKINSFRIGLCKDFLHVLASMLVLAEICDLAGIVHDVVLAVGNLLIVALSSWLFDLLESLWFLLST